MKKQDLEKVHRLYKENIKSWELYEMTYDGGDDFIEFCLYRYSAKESITNWKDRIKNGYNFNYAQSIIDLFNYYLTEKEASRELGKLAEDPQWEMFSKDCDLDNSDFPSFMNAAQKLSSTTGSIGILVNKPYNGDSTTGGELSYGIYPYVTMYSLSNILDWEFVRDPMTHRKVLSYLKLYEEDGSYLIWYPDKWEQWILEGKANTPKMIASGSNSLGEIPFIWMPNVKRSRFSYLGRSDIAESSRIVCSVVRNLSCGEEILKLAGFPMLRIPMEKDIGPDEKDDNEDELTGPKVVHQFDPSLGEHGKPDWMPTEILEPIEAILKWIDRKATEVYRTAHLNGIHGQRTSGEPQSGLALRYNFKQLFSVLSKKSENMTEAEYQIIRLWLKWQNKGDLFKGITIKRSKDFSIDELAVELDNNFTAMRNMVSKSVRVAIQMKTADFLLPDMTTELREIVKTETEENTPDQIPLHDDSARYETGGGKKVRPADQA